VVSDAFLYLLVQWRTGLGIETIPLLYVGTSSAYLLLAAPLGRWADHVGRTTMFVAGHVCVLMVYAAVAWLGINTPALVLCLVLHGTYYAATDGVLAALVSAATPADVRASSLSALGTATSLARLGSSLVVGLLWAWRGPQVVAVAGVLGVTLSIVCSAIVMRGQGADSRRIENATA
jgi:MFS family permease